tara:strand:+ start:11337 stop:11945 length:609 start_codon:yes stop_codon:yes gene_type:complete
MSHFNKSVQPESPPEVNSNSKFNFNWLLFIGFILLIGFLAKGLKLNPNFLPSQMIQKPFPEFQLRSIESHSALKHKQDILGQPALVHIWATWCQICLHEHDELMAIRQKWQPSIYGVNYKDDPSKVTKWFAGQGQPYNFTLDDRTGSLGVDLGVYGTPETYVIDAKGIILARHVGPISLTLFEREFLPLLNLNKSKKEDILS